MPKIRELERVTHGNLADGVRHWLLEDSFHDGWARQTISNQTNIEKPAAAITAIAPTCFTKKGTTALNVSLETECYTMQK